MSKGWLSATGNRLEGGIPLRIPIQMLSGRIQEIPSNKNSKGRRGKDSVYHKPRNILLLENAVWIEKCRRDISTSVIKSCTEQEVIRDVEETFRTLRKINMKLNPKKCTFGMKEGVFLGYKVNSDGLTVYPDKVEAILSLPSQRFDATNNEAEYEALIAGLKIVEQMGVQNLQANVDSRLVANQVNGTMHAGTRSVVAKALRIGYYWPTMHEDARKSIQECQECQVYKPVPRNPQQKLSLITSPWSFYKWGIDIARPFLEGPGKVKFLIVAIDYFTKFGLPGEIISDNEKQFQDNPFKDWYEKLCIRQHFTSVKHPQTNGLVERANRSLREGIKARLDERSTNWMEELPHVLWAHRKMIKSSNGDTPFSLTYGTEVVIPAEIGMPTLRTAEINLEENKEALEINLDLMEERREQAAIREAKKQRDLVYRNNEASRAEDTGKLGPMWEGLYEVTEALGKGAYKLRDRDGNQLPRT
ncbi:reverse transcriptase domain-containing protein [Tanacetum coccineum]|uniref:Reverse transcriptase domain-containing protein n=1 Tax=Tanacetum coccineum TaxID=301880 RepID=A0ABQ4Z716_9ASTR